MLYITERLMYWLQAKGYKRDSSLPHVAIYASCHPQLWTTTLLHWYFILLLSYSHIYIPFGYDVIPRPALKKYRVKKIETYR